MGYPVLVTISAGGTTTEPGGKQNATVSVTYRLGLQDRDIAGFVADKAPEVVEAQQAVWRSLETPPQDGTISTARRARRAMPRHHRL